MVYTQFLPPHFVPLYPHDQSGQIHHVTGYHTQRKRWTTLAQIDRESNFYSPERWADITRTFQSLIETPKPWRSSILDVQRQDDKLNILLDAHFGTTQLSDPPTHIQQSSPTQYTHAIHCIRSLCHALQQEIECARQQQHGIPERELLELSFQDVAFDPFGRATLHQWHKWLLPARDMEVNITGRLEPLSAFQDLSPEHVRGDALHLPEATIVYKLGLILSILLTGQHPIPKGRTDFEMLTAVMQGEPTLPSKQTQGLPIEFDEIVAKALAKQPEERYPTIQAFQDALQPHTHTPAPTPPDTQEDIIAMLRHSLPSGIRDTAAFLQRYPQWQQEPLITGYIWDHLREPFHASVQAETIPNKYMLILATMLPEAHTTIQQYATQEGDFATIAKALTQSSTQPTQRDTQRIFRAISKQSPDVIEKSTLHYINTLAVDSCPQQWEELERIDGEDDRRRYCEICERNVYRVQSADDLPQDIAFPCVAFEFLEPEETPSLFSRLFGWLRRDS